MQKMSQKEAVFSAVTDVLDQNDIEFHEGMNVATVLTREMRAKVNNVLFEGLHLISEKTQMISLPKRPPDFVTDSGGKYWFKEMVRLPPNAGLGARALKLVKIGGEERLMSASSHDAPISKCVSLSLQIQQVYKQWVVEHLLLGDSDESEH